MTAASLGILGVGSDADVDTLLALAPSSPLPLRAGVLLSEETPMDGEGPSPRWPSLATAERLLARLGASGRITPVAHLNLQHRSLLAGGWDAVLARLPSVREVQINLGTPDPAVFARARAAHPEVALVLRVRVRDVRAMAPAQIAAYVGPYAPYLARVTLDAIAEAGKRHRRSWLAKVIRQLAGLVPSVGLDAQFGPESGAWLAGLRPHLSDELVAALSLDAAGGVRTTAPRRAAGLGPSKDGEAPAVDEILSGRVEGFFEAVRRAREGVGHGVG